MTTHQLQYSKATYPCTYKQIKYLSSFDNVKIDVCSTSQLLKRLEMHDASELIDLAKSNEEILITDKQQS